MNIPLDEVVYFDAITSHPSTMAATDADSTPTFAVYEEATDTDIGVGGNLTKRTSLTGNYRGSFTASAANGFEVGKWYSVIGSATVNSIAGKGVLRSFRIVAAEVSAGKTPSTIAASDIATDAIDAASIKADAVTEIQSGLATAANLAIVAGYLDTEIADIKAKTDLIPASPAAVGSQMDLVNAPNATAITAIQSGLATASALSTLAGKFTGITLLADWLRRAFRKDSGTPGMATAESEIQTGGTATYVGTTDNLEAIKDAGGSGLTAQNITDIGAEVESRMAGRTIVIQSPLDGSKVTLYANAEYVSGTQRLTITNSTGGGWPNLTTWNALKFVVRTAGTETAYGTGVVVVASGAGASVAFSFTSEEMAAMLATAPQENATCGAWAYQSGDESTRFPLLAEGKLRLVDVPWVA